MKKRGKGLSTIGYSTGLYQGADPSQAQISLKMDGTFNLLVGSVDMGQGCKTALTQIAAEELGVPYEAITFTNDSTEDGPYCAGSYASRVTFMTGNAIIKACLDLKKKIMIFASSMVGIKPEQLEVVDNKILAKNNPEVKPVSMSEIGSASTSGGEFLVGYGAYTPGGPYPIDPVTGEQPFVAAAAFATCVVEVEVDTETGVVEVLKATHVYDIGKAINPLLCKGQINGGAAMGIGMALSEDIHPYWPSVNFPVDSLGDYVVVTAADMPPDDKHAIVQVPHPDGPFGAKGFSEMSANAPIPAITAAIHDAIGVWITQFPITPEMILKALESKQARG
ncbi:MAG: xanthine dehydrogenase family protein molybdopterin-binding subunit [bacterium]